MEGIFEELDDAFGPSVIEGISRGVDAASKAIRDSAVSVDALRKAISMRRSELLMLHAAEIGGTTLRNYRKAIKRSRRNQGGKR